MQSETLNMGIEVVRAITEHDGLTYHLINSYFGKGLSGDQIVAAINKNNTKGKFKGSVQSIDGVAVISPTKGLYDSAKHRNLVIDKLNEKSRLFEQYKHYKINGLYCITQTSLIDESDYPYIIEACKKSVFNLVFIDCNNTILQWNASSDDFIIHNIM